MSRKHYVSVAEIISHQSLSTGEKAALAMDFADLFGKDNPHFDRERFLKACGIMPGLVDPQTFDLYAQGC